MLIITATNVTHSRAKNGNPGQPILARKDGTADYDVWVGINQHCLWKGSVNGHVRDAGAEVLLRLIADHMEEGKKRERLAIAFQEHVLTATGKLWPKRRHVKKPRRKS